MLSGGHRDPIVGRDVLIGIASALAMMTFAKSIDPIARAILGLPPSRLQFDPDHLNGVAYSFGEQCVALFASCFFAVSLVALVLVGRAITGRRWPGTLIAWALAFGIFWYSLGANLSWWPTIPCAIGAALVMLVLQRFGVLAVVVALFLLNIPMPIGGQWNDWTNRPYLWAIAAVSVLTVTAYLSSLAGRSSLRSTPSLSGPAYTDP